MPGEIGTMLYVQSILLVVGCTALGMCVVGWGLALPVDWLTHKPGSWGFGTLYVLMFGGIVGAIVGFFQGYRQLARGTNPWKLPTWTGVAVGIALLLLFRLFRPHNYFLESWLVTSIYLLAAGMLGGMAGTFWELISKQPMQEPVQGPRRRKQKGGASPGKIR